MRDSHPLVISVDIDSLVELVTERVFAQLPNITTTSTRLAYTPSTLASELGVTSRTIRAAITRGELQAVKRAGKWLIPASAVSDWTTDVPVRRSVRAHKAMRTRRQGLPSGTLSETLRALEKGG
jgi:excisionase family DNA binding protein